MVVRTVLDCEVEDDVVRTEELGDERDDDEVVVRSVLD